jgi:hypothetical protein
VGGREESIRLINDNLEHNNRKGEVVAHHYNMVKIPHAEPGYIGLNSWVNCKGKGVR